jgi:hypothetical protein
VKLTVIPDSGNALGTIFVIQMNGFLDNDAPITYKYHVYLSQELME